MVKSANARARDTCSCLIAYSRNSALLPISCFFFFDARLERRRKKNTRSKKKLLLLLLLLLCERAYWVRSIKMTIKMWLKHPRKPNHTSRAKKEYMHLQRGIFATSIFARAHSLKMRVHRMRAHSAHRQQHGKIASYPLNYIIFCLTAWMRIFICRQRILCVWFFFLPSVCFTLYFSVPQCCNIFYGKSVYSCTYFLLLLRFFFSYIYILALKNRLWINHRETVFIWNCIIDS